MKAMGNWPNICEEKIRQDPFLTPCSKTNSTWMKDKTIKSDKNKMCQMYMCMSVCTVKSQKKKKKTWMRCLTSAIQTF